MTRSVTLDARQRQAWLDRYRKDPDPEVRFHAHFLLLLDEGHTWATVAALLFCIVSADGKFLQSPEHALLSEVGPPVVLFGREPWH